MGLFLGMNIDHVATLRQARYATMLASPNAEPSIVAAALAAKAGGADSITMHVRGDRRHVQVEDVFAVQAACDLPLNLEMANTSEMLALALKVKPAFVCLVPENREEITTEGGLDVASQVEELRSTVESIQAVGSKVSMFIDPDPEQIAASAAVQAEIVELHTGCYANAVGAQREDEMARLVSASRQGCELGLQINAGHGINYENLAPLFRIPRLVELNTGHSIVSRALSVGMEQAVREMVDLMRGYKGMGS
jgi:pyridoxine 5-phosphate synthase